MPYHKYINSVCNINMCMWILILLCTLPLHKTQKCHNFCVRCQVSAATNLWGHGAKMWSHTSGTVPRLLKAQRSGSR